MQVVANVIAGLCTLHYLGFCSELPQQINGEDLIASTDLLNETDLYFKITQSSEGMNETNRDTPISVNDDFTKASPVIQDRLFEDMVLNTSKNATVRKRDIPKRGLTDENKLMLLQLHNFYRSNVTPSAGNMAYMEWDDELARLAQLWSDGCVFDHGIPENDYPTQIGQNLYNGGEYTGVDAVKMWFEEYRDYDLRTQTCTFEKQCGHYEQLAWHESSKLGCGMTNCDPLFLITCHYSPPLLKPAQIYLEAKPCSQCPSTGIGLEKKGSLCLNNLCITREQCKNNPFDCQFARCDLVCQNCGRLDKEKCLCNCADGWDSTDCTYLCTNKDKRCHMKSGVNNTYFCSRHGFKVQEFLCRKMCGACQTVNISVSDNICCDGHLCDDGFALDAGTNSSCKCKPLCPGPHCDYKEVLAYQAALESDANYSDLDTEPPCDNIERGMFQASLERGAADYLLPYFTSWIVAFTLHQIILWKVL